MAVGSSSAPKDDKKPVAKTPARDTVLVGTTGPDRVAMVSRDKNGDPDQTSDFELLVADDASDREREAAENKPVPAPAPGES